MSVQSPASRSSRSTSKATAITVAAGPVLSWAVAAAAVAVAFIVIRSYLRERGDGWFSAVGLALVVVGTTLYAVLPGMEFSALAAHETGTDIAAAQDALQPWFISVLVGGSVAFAAALVVFGVSRMIPIGVVQFYLQSRPRSWRYCRWQRR